MSDRIFTVVRQQRVSWFDVRQLMATAAKTLASTVIGSMSGRRELMAALDPGPGTYHDLRGDPGADEALWIDWIADCGDGWNASYSVAWLVGRDTLRLKEDCSATPQPVPQRCDAEVPPSGEPGMLDLPGGRVLLLGGDQVYPTASVDAYQNRFVGPMTCARAEDTSQCPDGRKLFAIPGNHDWYDGLTSFIRLFCQSSAARRWIGTWRTQQRRSYFALHLPHRWWLWGVDMALEDDLDPPQQEYFRAMAEKLEPGDRLILALPAPVWMKVSAAAAEKDDTASRLYAKLQLILDIAGKKGVQIPLLLSGDLHYYAHHHGDGPDERHFVVCGGGGAFGIGTTEVAEQVTPPGGGTASCGALFPDRAQSRRMRWGALGFPCVNLAFTAALAAFHLLLLWQLGAALRWSGVAGGWAGAAATQSLGDFFCTALIQVAATPSLAAWAAVLLAGFFGFAMSGGCRDQPKTAALVGLVHGVVQLAGFVAIAWLLARLPLLPRTLLLFGLSYVWCGGLFGLYLALSHRLFRMHDQEVYSAQGIEDWKSFLRLKVAPEGVTVHAIGVRTVARRWRAAPGVGLVERWRSFGTWSQVTLPHGCLRAIDPVEPLAPQLIEPPFTITGGAKA